jgi:hypothetical protein
MPYLLLRHKVTDYEQWKSVFDAHCVTRQANGSRGGQLFRNASDPNELVVLLEWDVLEKARQFADGKIVESWRLFDQMGMMQQLGVIPAPGQAG